MLRKMREKVKGLKLSAKMVLAYFVAAGIFFCIAIFALQVSIDIFAEQMYEKSLQELDYYVRSVNEGLAEVEDYSYELALDSSIQETLSEMRRTDPATSDYRQLLTVLTDQLLYDYNPGSPVRSIRYTDPYGTTVETGSASWDLPDEIYQSLVEEMQEERGAFTMYGPTEECPYLLCGRVIRNSLDMSLDTLGTVVLTCDMAEIITEYKSSLEAANAALFVYSDEGIVYQDISEEEQPELPGIESSQGYRVEEYKGELYFMCWLRSGTTGWMYVNFFPYSEIYGTLIAVRYALIACFAVTFLLIVFIMRRVSAAITAPLERLTESMKIVETGDFQRAKLIPVDGDRADEVGTLEREFKVMLDKIDILIRENYEKQLLLKDTKYQMLQAQINPHFLYNTLNALHWLTRAGKTEDAGKMIVELGKLLRATFAGEPYAMASEEMAMVRSYTVIQKYRYRDRAVFSIEEEGNLEKYVVPRMILQPLVENALYYGVDDSLKTCHIRMCAAEEEKTLRFEVEDTGRGMDAEELEKVRNFTVVPKGHGIGLKNIWERLRITYEEFEFSIESEPGAGTRVLIRIPKSTEWKS